MGREEALFLVSEFVQDTLLSFGCEDRVKNWREVSGKNEGLGLGSEILHWGFRKQK